MEVIPAIDLRGGRVVRLYQGNFQRETVYSVDPVEVALRWQEEGAPRIHVVDLDGARAGQLVNLTAINAIATGVAVPVQVGGGIRDLGTAEELVGMGVERVVLGTAAARNPALIQGAIRALGAEAVVVGLDARGGRLGVQGWSEELDLGVAEVAKGMVELGVCRFIYTDISKDGTLGGPDVRTVAALLELTGVSIIASGGVSSLQDLERLAQMGVEGAIVGSALYRGIVDLREAVRRFGR